MGNAVGALGLGALLPPGERGSGGVPQRESRDCRVSFPKAERVQRAVQAPGPRCITVSVLPRIEGRVGGRGVFGAIPSLGTVGRWRLSVGPAQLGESENPRI